MSILQLALIVLVLPGLYRAFTGLSGLFSKYATPSKAKRSAFIIVAISAAIIAAPTLTLGLPAAFRLFTYALYLGYVGYGAMYFWDLTFGRNSKNGNNGGNGTTGTK